MIFEFIIFPRAVFLGVTLAGKLIERQRARFTLKFATLGCFASAIIG
jgi:hypothetical protein